MTDGVVYVATGAGYVDLACQSARSLRLSNPGLLCDIYTDDPARPGLDLFDVVHPVPEVNDRVRMMCLAECRFDRALSLDADTLVVGDLGDLFDIADVFDLAMAHEVRRKWDLIRQGLTEKTPYAFPQWNSGVILFRNHPPVAEFFRDWYRRFRASGQPRDQVILKDMLWRTELRTYVLPPEFNLRRVTLLDAWEPLDCDPKIIHSHRLLQHLSDPGAERVTTLKRIVELEREALAAEWHGQPRWI